MTVQKNISYVGKNAFEGFPNLETFRVQPDASVPVTIGSSALASCPNLCYAELAGVKEIGTGAFYHCYALTDQLLLYDGLETIGRVAFWGAGLSGKIKDRIEVGADPDDISP